MKITMKILKVVFLVILFTTSNGWTGEQTEKPGKPVTKDDTQKEGGTEFMKEEGVYDINQTEYEQQKRQRATDKVEPSCLPDPGKDPWP